MSSASIPSKRLRSIPGLVFVPAPIPKNGSTHVDSRHPNRVKLQIVDVRLRRKQGYISLDARDIVPAAGIAEVMALRKQPFGEFKVHFNTHAMQQLTPNLMDALASATRMKRFRQFLQRWKYVYVDHEGGVVGTNWDKFMLPRNPRLKTKEILTRWAESVMSEKDVRLLRTRKQGSHVKELTLLGDALMPDSASKNTVRRFNYVTSNIRTSLREYKRWSIKSPESKMYDAFLRKTIRGAFVELMENPKVASFVKEWKYVYLVDGSRLVGSNLLLLSTMTHMRFKREELEKAA